MGNFDLVIIFNDETVFIVKGEEYDTQVEAVQIALNKWVSHIDDLKKSALYPEEIEDKIKNIQLYEFIE